MNGRCETCPRDSECAYPYKPTECRDQMKFVSHSDTPRTKEPHFIHVLFDGPPSHESGRFVEVEDESGRSISFGEWIDRGDGFWSLKFPDPRQLERELAAALQKQEDMQIAFNATLKNREDTCASTMDALAAVTAERDAAVQHAKIMLESEHHILGVCKELTAERDAEKLRADVASGSAHMAWMHVKQIVGDLAAALQKQTACEKAVEAVNATLAAATAERDALRAVDAGHLSRINGLKSRVEELTEDHQRMVEVNLDVMRERDEALRENDSLRKELFSSMGEVMTLRSESERLRALLRKEEK